MKKKLLLSLICASLMLTACGNSDTSHDVAVSDSPSSVEEVLAARMAEEDAENYMNQGDLSEVPGLSENAEDDYERQSGVNEDAPEPEMSGLDESVLQTEGVDIDLTVLSSIMVYSQVYSLISDPDRYLGKTVKMTGMYACTDTTDFDQFYCACIIQDATQCCSQGIEFVLDDSYSFPDDYPKYGDDVTVIGEFDIYQDGGYTYCTLRNARLVD